MGNLWEFSRNWQKKNGWAWDGLKFLVVMTLKSSIRQEWRSGGFPLNFCGCDLQLMTFFQSSVPTLWHSSQWGKRTGPVPIEFYLFWRCLHNPITFLFWLKKTCHPEIRHTSSQDQGSDSRVSQNLMVSNFGIPESSRIIRNHGNHGGIMVKTPYIAGWWFGNVWNIFYFSIYWEFHHPNWLHHFSEGWLNHQAVGHFHHVKISLIARRPTIWAWRRPSWRWLRIWCRCSWTWKLGSAMAWKMMDIFGRIWLIKYNMSCKSGWKRWNHWRLKIVGEKLVVSTWNWLNQWWCPEDSAKQDWGLAGWEENSENSCPRSGGQDLQKDADGCFKNKGIFWALLSNLVCLEKNLESQQIECWVLVGRWFLGVAEALGLKVKTGVKVLEIQTGDGGLQGVKIEQEGAEDRARAGICYGKEALQWKTFKKLKRRMSSTQNGCFSSSGWSCSQTYGEQHKGQPRRWLSHLWQADWSYASGNYAMPFKSVVPR